MRVRIPENIFLDTTVINFILDYGEQIHNGGTIPEEATAWICRDIQALRDTWLTGQRASWRLTVSPSTITEIQRTRDMQRRQNLLWRASELYFYSEECALASDDDNNPVCGKSISTLSLLPDAGDKQLVHEAVLSGCDTFCTRDWNTILRLRDSLRDVPLSFVSPYEWWQRILPYSALFA